MAKIIYMQAHMALVSDGGPDEGWTVLLSAEVLVEACRTPVIVGPLCDSKFFMSRLARSPTRTLPKHTNWHYYNRWWAYNENTTSGP